MKYFLFVFFKPEIPLFIEDLRNGCPKKIYQSHKFADITKSPLPD
jgi:hypothetical protein